MALEAGQAYVDIVPRLHPGFGEKVGAMVEGATRPVLEAVQQRFYETGERLRSIGKRMTTFVTLPLLAGGVAAFKFASDLNESTSKAQVVFGQMFGAVSKWASNSAKTLGISRQEALEGSATFGNLFRAMGIGLPVAADLSTKIVGLASDLASFNNANPQDVLEALRAGLVGEVEPLRRFGINLSQARIEQKALEMGLWDGKDAISAGAKAQAAYALITQDSALAQGDFARTADGAANKQRILTARFKDAAAEIGNRLLPIGQKLMDWVGSLLEGFGKLGPTGQKIVLMVLGLVAAAGPLAYILGAISTVIGALLSPIGLVIVALAGVALAATKLGLDWSAVWRWVKQAAQDAWAWIQANVIPAAKAVARAVGTAFRWLADNAPGWWNAIRTAAETLFAWLERYVFPVVTRLVDAFKVGFMLLAGIVYAGVQVVLFVWDHFGQYIVTAVVNAWNFVQGIFEAALTIIKGILDIFVGLFTGDWGRLWDGVKAVFSGVWNAISATVGYVLAGIINAINFLGAVISVIWSGIWSAIKSIATGALNALYFIFVGLPAKIGAGIAAGAAWLWGQITGFVGNITNKIAAVASFMYDIGRKIVKGIWHGIEDAAGWLWGKVKGFVSDLVSFITDPLGIFSPSRVMAEVGRNIVRGLGIGIEDQTASLQPIALDLASTASVTRVSAPAPSSPLSLLAGELAAPAVNVNVDVHDALVIREHELGDFLAEPLRDALLRLQKKDGPLGFRED